MYSAFKMSSQKHILTYFSEYFKIPVKMYFIYQMEKKRNKKQ